ncbi:MAG: FtsB family cell division protein [Alphaproteobacteria bacterium]
MEFVDKFKLSFKRVLPTILGFLLLFYLLFHILFGDRGLLSYPERSRAIEAKKTELAQLVEKKETLARRVKLLQRDGLDFDMLEERARAMLNFTRPDEVVILITDPLNPQ